MLRTAPHSPPRMEPPIPEGATTAFDWSSRLSIDAIRSHTKTDDVIGVEIHSSFCIAARRWKPLKDIPDNC